MKNILRKVNFHINFRTLAVLFVLILFNSSLVAKSNTNETEKDKEYVISLVQKAKQYIAIHGREKAVEEFNKRNGLFSKGSYYVFSLDYNGNVLANMNIPYMVGTNQINLQNAEGVYLVKEEIEMAKQGGGWLVGRKKKHPETGTLECKKSYILPIKGEYFIGSGYYYPADAQGTCQ